MYIWWNFSPTLICFGLNPSGPLVIFLVLGIFVLDLLPASYFRSSYNNLLDPSILRWFSFIWKMSWLQIWPTWWFDMLRLLSSGCNIYFFSEIVTQLYITNLILQPNTFPFYNFIRFAAKYWGQSYM